MKRGGSACALFFLCACLFACHSTEVPNQTTPAALRIGVLPENEVQENILESIGAGHFLPATVDDFSHLQAVLAELALLNQELE